MPNNLIDQIHAIIRCGLSLRDRLEAGAVLEPTAVQETLLALLAPLAIEEKRAAEKNEGVDQARSAIRYALASWLDEWLLNHSAWGEAWRDYTLEACLYAGSRHGDRFWQEAHLAEVRGDVETLNVMYWCAALGFRGAWCDKPEQIEAWTMRVRDLLEKSAPHVERAVYAWNPGARPADSATEFPLQRMRFAALLTFSCLVSLVLVILWRVA